jgi:serine protease Do
VGELTTPQIVDLLRPSVVQIAVLKPGSRGVGTGVVFDVQGHILTNWHVVNGAANIQVSLASGDVLAASLFREDPVIDLAVIKVQKDSLRPAVFGDSNRLEVGEDVIAIGHALGLAGGPTVTRGVVSALNRTIVGAAGEELTGLIQTDAAINEGNSGGPLVNAHGEVVGLNTARVSGGFGIGFAININAAKETATRLIALGPPPPSGYLGAFGSDITPALAVLLGLPVSSGFGVEQVDPRSPAAVAGILIDDIIVGMNDTVIRGGTDLTEFLRKNPPGTKVRVRVIRGDFFTGFGLLALDLTLAERNE